jgi:hypothetical protein
MKAKQTGFFTLLLWAIFLLTSNNERVASKVLANAEEQGKSNLPAFLEKGKTYNFNPNTSATFPYTMMGKVVQLDSDAGWVYINHYVAERREKVIVYKYQGYSWINLKQVFQCSEMQT